MKHFKFNIDLILNKGDVLDSDRPYDPTPRVDGGQR